MVDAVSAEAPTEEAPASAVVSSPAAPVAPAPDSPTDRPEWLPEKFQSPAEMAKAYAQLEAKLSGKPSGLPEANPQAPANTPTDAQKVSPLVTAQAEYAEKGSLSPGTLQALSAAGIDQSYIDLHIAGVEALQNQWHQEGMAIVGGEDQYSAMVNWASTNLTAAQIAAFDKAVTSQDSESRELAIRGLSGSYKAAVGHAPQLLMPGTGSNGAANGGYASQREVQADMTDPRYQSDPAFRANVFNRISKTTAF